MRRVAGRALLAGVVGMGLTSSAWAASPFGNRTDVTDIANNMVTDDLDIPLTTNRAYLQLLEGSSAFASGSVAAGTGMTVSRIFWVAFEPDQPKRSDNGGSVQQKDQLFLDITLNGSPLFTGVVPGCKAKVQAKGPRDATTIEKGEWSVSCNKKANATLGLTDQEISELQNALGKKVVGKGTLNIKGKCSGNNCDVPST